MRWSKFLYLLIGFVFLNTKLLAFKDDSLKVKKQAKHYFHSMIYFDLYGAGARNLNEKNFVSQKLKTYQVSQSVLGFNVPIFT